VKYRPTNPADAIVSARSVTLGRLRSCVTVAEPSRRLSAMTVSVVTVGLVVAVELVVAAEPARTRCYDQNRPIADTAR
jgi:hypothetical protein